MLMSETGKSERTAFAVYSSTDKSLRFYMREEVPLDGEDFEGREADAVYADILDLDGDIPWFGHALDIETVEVVDEGIAPKSTARWFAWFESMTSCDVARLDVSSVVSLDQMFEHCSAIGSIDLSGLFAPEAGSARYMFDRCESLRSVDLSGADLAHLSSAPGMFMHCGSLESLDLSGAGLSGVSDASHMLDGCRSLSRVDISGLSGAPLRSVSGMFKNCWSLEELDLTPLDTSRARSTSFMLMGCDRLASVDLSGLDTSSVADMSYMFASCCSLKELDLSGLDTSNAVYMPGMFSGCNSLESIDLSGLDVSNVAVMRDMFAFCENLQRLDAPTTLAARAEDVSRMLYYCRSLASVDLSWIDLAAVSAAEDMIEGCDDLPGEMAAEIERAISGDEAHKGSKTAFAVFSAFDDSLRFYKRREVPKPHEMFDGREADEVFPESSFRLAPWLSEADYIETVEVVDEGIAPATTSLWFSGFEALERCDLSRLDTSNVVDMSWMFAGCDSLTELDLSGFSTSKVADMSSMFEGCERLARLDISGFDVRGVHGMPGMFAGCAALEELDISGFDAPRAENLNRMFEGCDRLRRIDAARLGSSPFRGMSRMFAGCSSLEELDIDLEGLSRWAQTDELIEGCSSLPAEKAEEIELALQGRPSRRRQEQRKTHAFAAYSAADRTLRLYRRARVPMAGEILDGRRADEVFPNVEDETEFRHWGDLAEEMEAVEVVDEGITPDSMDGWFAGFANLKSCDLSKLASRWPCSMDRLFDGCESLQSAAVAGPPASRTSRMFAGCGSLAQVDLTGLDVSGALDMSSMFQGCSSLENVDLSGFRTPNLMRMRGMFEGCSSLESLDLTSLDVSYVEDMSSMFAGCRSLTSVDLSGLRTPNLMRMRGMFEGCESLADLDLTGFDFSRMIDSGRMIAGCESLRSVTYSDVDKTFAIYTDEDKTLRFYHRPAFPQAGDVFEGRIVSDVLWGADAGRLLEDGRSAPWEWLGYDQDIEAVEVVDEGIAPTSTSGWFSECANMTSCDLSRLDMSKVGDMAEMFGGCSSLETIDLTGFATAKAEDLSSMFNGCSSLKEIDLSVLDASRAKDMKYMFSDCESLEEIDLSALDTSKVVDMSGMFWGCESLTKANLAGIDTSNVRDMSWMFCACDSLEEVDLSGLDTSSAAFTNRMFSHCERLRRVDLSGIDTSNVRDMSWMFESCPALEEVDLTGFDTSSVRAADGMFWGCRGLKRLDVSSFDTSNTKHMPSMFEGCSRLESLDLSGFDTSNCANIDRMFAGCENLEHLDVSSFDYSNTKKIHNLTADCRALPAQAKEATGRAIARSRKAAGAWAAEDAAAIALETFDAAPPYKDQARSSAFAQAVDALRDEAVAEYAGLLDLDIPAAAEQLADKERCAWQARASTAAGREAAWQAISKRYGAKTAERVRLVKRGPWMRAHSVIEKRALAGSSLATIEPKPPAERLEPWNMPLYSAGQGQRALDQSIAALESRAQGFPAEKVGWAMRAADGAIIGSASLGELLIGAEDLMIGEYEGRLMAAFWQDGSYVDEEIRLSPSPAADWDECEPPHTGLWAAGSGEPMQWAIGACPTEAELVGAERGGNIRAVAAAAADGTWSATVTDAGREVVRACGLASAEEARRACEMGAFRRGGAVRADSAARFAMVSATAAAAAAGTVSAFASAPGIDGEALLADWARESRGADPEKTAALDAVEALGPLSVYVCGNVRPAVQGAGRTVEAVRDGAAQAGILRAEAMEAARAASVDAAVSMMAKRAEGAAVVYRDLAFAPSADGTWTVMKESAEGAFSPFEAGWRPGALSFDEQAAAADVAKMEAATPAECAAGRWAETGARAEEAPAKAAPAKRAQAPARVDPALLATADALGSSSLGAR